jgi:hypothetical protein
MNEMVAISILIIKVGVSRKDYLLFLVMTPAWFENRTRKNRGVGLQVSKRALNRAGGENHVAIRLESKSRTRQKSRKEEERW